MAGVLMKQFSRIFHISHVLWILFFILSPLIAQRVKITKIIDTNLFEINNQDTVKLANVEIPSKTTTDSLLREYFIPDVLKYEKKHLLRKYFIIEYADRSDSLHRIRAVYLYKKHLLSKDLVNDEFLLKGYGKYIPLIDSEQQEKCEAAEIKAKEKNRGIWKEGKYFHEDLGMRGVFFDFGYGRIGENHSYTKYMVSFQNEQNRVFSAKIEISYYRREFLDYPEYYFDGEYFPPQKKVGNDLLINTEINGNSKYIGLKFLLRLYYSNLDSESSLRYIPFLPGIGLNIGEIRKIYASITILPTSHNRLYLMSLSAHYFLPMPFWDIHFYYYSNPKEIYDDNREFRLKLGFNLNDKFSFNFDVSNIIVDESSPKKNYYSLGLGIGYIFR